MIMRWMSMKPDNDTFSMPFTGIRIPRAPCIQKTEDYLSKNKLY